MECVRFENKGMISINGGDCEEFDVGGGSGGSCHIICEKFIMNFNDGDDIKDDEGCYIFAKGGKNEFITKHREYGGEGGFGRIRIETTDDLMVNQCIEGGSIQPKPYVG